MNQLKNFFTPKSIAVIGASNHAGKVGNDVIVNLKSYYHGRVIPINPNDPEVAGFKSYASIAQAPIVPDLAIIVIPAVGVIEAVTQCGLKGCRNLIIISAGFKEVGGEGALLEAQLTKLKEQYKLRILGPNCLGYINTKPLVNASFAAPFTKPGNVAFFSQSGALGTAVLDTAEAERLGLSTFVSVGNKSDISELDLLDYFAGDSRTKVILAYLESIVNGEQFMVKARAIAKKKPIIILKSGKTVEGSHAVSSHTGSLAGSREIYSAAFKQSGVIEAEDMMDFFDLAEGFSYQNYPAGNRVAILTNAGGPGILLTDNMTINGLQLANLSSKTITKLKAVLPSAANTHNPIDVLGDALPDRYGAAFKILLADKNIDSIIVALTPQRMTQIKETAEMIGRLKKNSTKTVILCFMGELEIVKHYQSYADNNLPQFSYPLSAAKVLGRMYAYGYWQRTHIYQKPATNKLKPIDDSYIGKGFMAENISRQILSKNGFPLHLAEFVKDVDQAVKVANKIGYPLALKVVSDQVIHKSDIGGVKIGIIDEADLRQSIDKMAATVKSRVKGAVIDGYILGEMVKGQEIIIGLKRDPVFGSAVMLGLGGIYTEVFKDVCFRIAPLTKAEAREMITELKVYPILSGLRGSKPLDIEALADLLVLFANFALANPKINEIDFNPVMLLEQGRGLKIVDVRISS